MNSLRAELGVWLLVVIGLVGIVASTISFITARNEAWRFFDQQLSIVAHAVDASGSGSQMPDSATTAFDPEDNLVVQVWDDRGRIIRHWPADVDLPRPSAEGFQNGKTGGVHWRRYAVVTPRFTVQVSQRNEVRDELALEAAYRSLAPILVTVPLTWLVLGFVINGILARLDRQAAGLLQQSAKDGPELLLESVPSEVRPFVASVKKSLARMHAALLAQRRFVADAAHAMRTPLAVLRTQAGNLRHVVTDEESRRRLDELELGLQRQARLVQQLLRLARSEAGELASERTAIDLTGTVTAAIAQLLPLADRRHQDIGLVRSDPACVLADREDLKVLTDNLLENAVHYTPDGGVIDVSVSRAGDSIVLEVRDTGSGIPEAELARVQEPFYRAAGTHTEGSGLGLAIAARAAERCGARLTLANRGDRSGLVATVCFPAH